MLLTEAFLSDTTAFIPTGRELLAEYAQLMHYHQKLQSQKHGFVQEYIKNTERVYSQKNILGEMIKQDRTLAYELTTLHHQLSQCVSFQKEINALREDFVTTFGHTFNSSSAQIIQLLIALRQKIATTLLLINEPSFFSVHLRNLEQYISQIISNENQDNKNYSSAIYIFLPLIHWLSVFAHQYTQMASISLFNGLKLREQLQRDYAHRAQELNVDLHLMNLTVQNLNHVTYDILSLQEQLNALENQLAGHWLSAPANSTYKWVLNNLTPIQIQDIIVTQPPHSSSSESGEITHPREKKQKYLFRILQQIKLLANVAQHYHQINCRNDGRLKITCANNITRLITDEFNFYPSEPLTMTSYQYLLKNIHHIAKSLPLNIHLVLASFPVLDAEQKLHNITVHVASGDEPLIHHHSKSRPSYIDPNYGYPFAQDKTASPAAQMPRISFNRPLQLGFGTIVRCITAGDVDFISNIEVCIEHKHHTGALCLDQELKNALLKKRIIPVQYSHVISSRSIRIMEKEPHNIQITQADAENPGVWLRDTHSQHYFGPKPKHRSDLYGFFGQKCQLRVFNPQPLPFLPGYFFEKATHHNVAVLEEQFTDQVNASLEQT